MINQLQEVYKKKRKLKGGNQPPKNKQNIEKNKNNVSIQQ